LANFFTARPPVRDLPALLLALRTRGIKLRDCASFGLTGHVRLGVLGPTAQRALAAAWRQYTA
jgi:histidinol-phosphate aminotransferase